jgi:hypothetical protein
MPDATLRRFALRHETTRHARHVPSAEARQAEFNDLDLWIDLARTVERGRNPYLELNEMKLEKFARQRRPVGWRLQRQCGEFEH